MEKVLLVIPKVALIRQPIIDNLVKLGYQVEMFDSRDSIVYRNIWLRRLIRRIPAFKSIKAWALRGINARLLTIANSYQPSILLVVGGENIAPDTIRKIRNRGITTLNWYFELMSNWTSIKKMAPAYNRFFTIDSGILERLKLENITNSSFASPAAELRTEKISDPKRYSVAFVGSYNAGIWKQREHLLETIKDLGLNIWGPKAWKKTALAPYYHGTAYGREVLNIYAQSKIALDIPYDHIVADGVGPRPFEVNGSGTALFFYDIRRDMHRLFKPNEEYVSFTTAEELREKIIYYLAHPDQLEAIARSGYKAVQKKHTYERRLQAMITETQAA